MRSTLSRIMPIIIVIALAFWLIGNLINPTLVLAAGLISVNPTSGPPGISVTVTGSGFSDNETGIAVTYDGTTVASGITANAQGGWSANFVVLASPSGSHTIVASGPNSASTTFTVTPAMSINRTSGAPGISVTVTGSGFSANETGIIVTYDGTPVASGITVNAQGGWSANFIVPASPSGSHTIDASGASTSATTVPDITFTTTAGISLSRTSSAPGSSVTITGFGFAAGETGITVTYDGTVVASGITANAQGGWSANFIVPASPFGSHTIDVSGASTSAATVPDIAFATTAGISVSRTSGAPGISVTVTGSGFSANETGITVTYDGTAAASGITANAQGGWSANFIVPASPSGSHTIDASGASTSAAIVPDVTFATTAGVYINRTSGAPGSSVTITGFGFTAGETGITVTYDGTAVASGITANSQGGWTTTFPVPESAAGSHNIGAYGSVTRAPSVGEAVFNIGAGISVSPTLGSVGATVDVTGSGFAPNSPLRFIYDNKDTPLEEVATTDATGSFSKSIIIPKSRHGTHTIEVEDGQKNSSKVTFTIESMPPAVPRPMSPKDGARLGIVGAIKPTLKWAGVTDASGVTFIVQVDTSPDFSQPILERTDIPGNQYALTAADALTRGEYYWRVKAVDGASNESAWSQPQSLKSGIMPPWALVTIIVLIVLVAIGTVYLLLARQRARKREAVAVAGAEIPQVVPAQWRLVEPEETSAQRPLPWKLALPQPAKGTKILSAEDQARLKVIVDFAGSLPLVEPGYNVDWLVDLVETGMGVEVSAQVYTQILKGEFQVRYEPAWMRHPTYQDLTVLLQGQPLLQDLNTFVDAVNRCASEAILLLRDIYRDSVTEIPVDFLERGGWAFISAVYSDAVSWFLGKSLRDPSERDYSIKLGGVPGKETETILCGEEPTSFAGPLIEAPDEKEALRLRALHLRLRHTYRISSGPRQVVGMMTQLGVQRDRLLNVLSQFSRLTQ